MKDAAPAPRAASVAAVRRHCQARPFSLPLPVAAMAAHLQPAEDHVAPAWGSLGGPLSDVLCCVATASDAPAKQLATCSLVCKGWHAVLKGDAPWAAALRQQFG